MLMKAIKKAFIFLVYLTISHLATAHTGKHTYFIHDGAFDDIFALYLNILDPRSDVKLIVAESTGESSCEEGLYATLGVLKKMNRLDIPVLCGPKQSLTTKQHGIQIKFPLKWRNELNDLNAFIWGYELPNKNGFIGFHDEDDIKALNQKIFEQINSDSLIKRKYDLAISAYQDDTSLEKIAKYLTTHKQENFILSTGPSVTLGHLAIEAPEALKYTDSVMIMSGAFKQDHNTPGLWGNVGNIQTVYTPPYVLNDSAEWNVYSAPKDLEVFLAHAKTHSFDVFMVPLNASTHAKIKPQYLSCLKQYKSSLPKGEKGTPFRYANDLTIKLFDRYRYQIHQGYLELWDTLSTYFFLNYVLEKKAYPYAKRKFVAVDAMSDHYPKAFYEKYQKKNLMKSYEVDYNAFTENLAKHQDWAKKITKYNDAFDTYGTTYAWDHLEDVPKEFQSHASNVWVFLDANEETFVDFFLHTLTGKKSLYKKCVGKRI